MRIRRTIALGAVILSLRLLILPVASAADTPPHIQNMSVPESGTMQLLFHSALTGPFRVQVRTSMDPGAAWNDVTAAVVTEVQTGVYMALLPKGVEQVAFFRIVSENETIAELKGWTVRLEVSAPSNGVYFVTGESPVVTVRILDNFAQGVTRDNLSALSLYMYGPQDPRLTVTPSKLLNASTNRAARPHHYIDLKTNPDAQVVNNVVTYRLRPVTDEAPGTYTLSISATLSADAIQQVMKFANVQIGTAGVEAPVVTKSQCASCHEGSVSGKMYLHHIDPGRSPTGSFALDYEPVTSCKSCHNNDGYAAIRDTNGVYIVDPIVRRAHGVHMAEELKLDFNTNSTTGDFRHYTHMEFPADVRNCTKCHVDNRWKTQPSQMACASCHDNTWFGPAPAPAGWVAHEAQANDNDCATCHIPDKDPGSIHTSIAENHEIPPPPMNAIDVAMTPPANGLYYVAGERPVVTTVFKNDAGNSIGDHNLVTTTNFSTASLFVYGPRGRALPVLTSIASLGIETKRASVTCATNGPWPINGKVFRLGINGTPATNITIVGASNLVTVAEFLASVNPVITNLNGGAKAFVSGSRVNIRSLIRGAVVRIEIYDGEVTKAMGWKAKGVVLEPDVFVAAVSTPANDLRPVTDPLDYADPKVTRTATNILYQLDDVAGLASGTYNIYVYYLPVTNKIAGLKALTGIGHLTFQVGTSTAEKKVATSCTDCHGNTIWHLAEGPIHAEPFDTDYCNACHDYGHPNTGDMFKNQGGTSLSGWSGYGAMPIVRRIHGVHRGNYLEHPEEIYANATKDTFGHIIFPQDIRNCTKCHSESSTWKENPSRMACLACHDTDEAKAHGTLMTVIPNPADPYGSGALEMCTICHGSGSSFSADKVHSIANPYVPPYPREKE
jgi:hypothetical protein